MKKFGRVIMLVLISLLGPLVWWLGGGTERNIELGFLTFGAICSGAVIAAYPDKFPWED